MALRLTGKYFDRPSFERLIEGLPPEWVDQALAAAGTATVRRRRLPAEQAVWLVLGMALYRGMSIVEIVEHLQLALPDRGGRAVAPSAPVQARARLGDEAIRWIFERSAHEWGCAYRKARPLASEPRACLHAPVVLMDPGAPGSGREGPWVRAPSQEGALSMETRSLDQVVVHLRSKIRSAA